MSGIKRLNVPSKREMAARALTVMVNRLNLLKQKSWRYEKVPRPYSYLYLSDINSGLLLFLLTLMSCFKLLHNNMLSVTNH